MFAIKLKKTENLLISVSYEDIRILVEELKELLKESERVSEELSAQIREKEEILENLIDLTEAKLNRLENLTLSSEREMSLKEKIFALHKQDKTSQQIAKQLNISVAEVNLAIKLMK
jgi:rRNA maturation endonuclease Nob1